MRAIRLGEVAVALTNVGTLDRMAIACMQLHAIRSAAAIWLALITQLQASARQTLKSERTVPGAVTGLIHFSRPD
jgi:hypothetical protein